MSALRELIMKSPDPMDATLKMGQAVAMSGMFGCSNPQQGIVVIVHCMEKGMPLLDWQARYHLIGDAGNKKPSMKAEAMLAAFEESGGKFRWLNDGASGEFAEIELETTHGTKQTVRYTMQQAKSAGLVKTGSGWTKNPDAMLRARVVSAGLRMVSPSIVVGVYTPEELDDLGGESQQAGQSEPATPPTAGEQPTEAKKGRGRPPGSGMKAAKETAAAGAGEPATQQPATEPQPAAAVTQSESAKPTETAKPVEAPKSADKPAEPAKQLADVNPVDPKGIDTPKLQFDRIMGKIAAIKTHWGDKAEANWAKLEGFMAANWGHVPGNPISPDNFEAVEEWADKQIAKYGLKTGAKSLEDWANQVAGK